MWPFIIGEAVHVMNYKIIVREMLKGHKTYFPDFIPDLFLFGMLKCQ